MYVNTAHHRLNLNHGAVAQSLLRSGGPALQAECNQYIARHGSVPVWGYATTGGGNLGCKYVIHAVGTYHDGPGGSAEKVCCSHCHWYTLHNHDIHNIYVSQVCDDLYIWTILHKFIHTKYRGFGPYLRHFL